MEFEFYSIDQSLFKEDDDDIYFEEDLIDVKFNEMENQSNTQDLNVNDELDILHHSMFYNANNKDMYEKENISSRNKKYTKGKIHLSNNAKSFKSNYYLVFTKKKKFPKLIIRKIHKLIQEPLNLKPMARDVSRFNDKYFQEYAENGFCIIQYLVTHKKEIIDSIPELTKYVY